MLGSEGMYQSYNNILSPKSASHFSLKTISSNFSCQLVGIRKKSHCAAYKRYA